MNPLDLAITAVAPPPDQQSGSGFVQFIPLILIFLVFYFVVFAPMRKRQRKHGEMLQKLKAGDRVLTNGGIYGTVVGVTDEIVQLKIADAVRIEVAKSAVSQQVEEG